MYTSGFLAAANLWDTFNSQFSSLEVTGKNGFKAATVVLIVVALVFKRTLAALLGVAAVVLVAGYFIYNNASAQSKIDQTIESMKAPSAVVVHHDFAPVSPLTGP